MAAPIIVIDDLREVDFGAFEGRRVGKWWSAWIAGAEVPGGVEPFEAFMLRAIGAVNGALEHAGPVLIVGHGGVYWSVQRHAPLSMEGTLANGVPVRDDPPDAMIPHWKTAILEPAVRPGKGRGAARPAGSKRKGGSHERLFHFLITHQSQPI